MIYWQFTIKMLTHQERKHHDQSNNKNNQKLNILGVNTKGEIHRNVLFSLSVNFDPKSLIVTSGKIKHNTYSCLNL